MTPTSGTRQGLAAVVALLLSLTPLASPVRAQGPLPPPGTTGGGPPGRSSAAAGGGARRPPVVAPVGGRVLRGFDPPDTPYGPGHRGVDLVARPGEQVRAALAGEVAFAGAVGGARWVTVAHGAGLETTYGGLVPTVAAGERVEAGSALGRATGRARVDWGARRFGAYIDPLGLLGGWAVRLVPVRDRD